MWSGLVKNRVWVRVCVLLREGVDVGWDEVCLLRIVVIGCVRALRRV